MPSIHQTNYSTFPVESSPFSRIPDMYILLKDTLKLMIFELSVPFETNISNIHLYMEHKYQPLCCDKY